MGIAIPSRKEVIEDIKNRGGLVAAVLPIHYSRALLRAFAIYPVEVWGPPKVDVSLGGAHLQPYVCSIVHNALSFLKMGGLNTADLILIPHTCDSLQGLTSVLIDLIKPEQAIIPLYLPRGQREEDIIFLADEFRSLYNRLSEFTEKKPSSENLLAAIKREETSDLLLAKLYKTRQQMGLSNLDFYRLVRSREYLPAEHFSTLAEEALQTGAKPQPGIPIILSGIVPEPMELLNTIDEMNGQVVADDLAACGRRLYEPGVSPEPFRRMAERIISAPPDPTRGNPIEERLKYLVEMAQNSGAKGVIFYEVKFCEPELFDLPNIRNSLKEHGLASIIIEVDINNPLPHQVATRISAFLEMLDN
ncbi:MAG: 2-hydroxyacyl-CoA dehydratase family protein [Pseudomonadota bacterium]|nr:2-hydroxyacyl-CoA dehydratase family protein [Pseudomonadota bacterium]